MLRSRKTAAMTAAPAPHSCLIPHPSSLLRHLLGLEDLDRAAIERILDLAERYVGVGEGGGPKRDALRGPVVPTLFSDPSTPPRTSFGLAARRLGADTIDFSPGGS